MSSHQKCHVITKYLLTNLHQSWSRYLGKAVSSNAISNSEKSLLSGHQIVCRSSQGLVLSSGVWSEFKSICFGICCYKGWLAVSDRNLSSEIEEISSRGIFFPLDKISSLQGMMFRSLFFESTLWKDLSTKTWLFLVEVIRTLQYPVVPFYQLWDKRSRSQMNWTSCDYLKRKEWVYDFQKGWSWNLKGPNGSALGQDIWRAATNFTNWVLIMLLVHSTKLEGWRW